MFDCLKQINSLTYYKFNRSEKHHINFILIIFLNTSLVFIPY